MRVLVEDTATLVAPPGPGQCVEADAVYTFGGVLKIPDNYRCTLRCNEQGQLRAVSALGSVDCAAKPWIPGYKPVRFGRGERLPDGWPANSITVR